MNDGEAEGRYCWTADIITDYDLSDEHVSKKFLGYEFKSITCRQYCVKLIFNRL